MYSKSHLIIGEHSSKPEQGRRNHDIEVAGQSHIAQIVWLMKAKVIPWVYTQHLFSECVQSIDSTPRPIAGQNQTKHN